MGTSGGEIDPGKAQPLIVKQVKATSNVREIAGVGQQFAFVAQPILTPRYVDSGNFQRIALKEVL